VVNEESLTPTEPGFERVDCPYCGETIEIFVDTSIPEQQYIEDCQVCCRPMTIRAEVSYTEDFEESVRVTALHENEY
jgi:hypothetical protein